MSLIRYPGSKAGLVREIQSRFPDLMNLDLWSARHEWEYREPFFGAGAVGFKVFESLSRKCEVWVNDLDPGMVSLWESVRSHPDELIALVRGFRPSADHFETFKREDGRGHLPAHVTGFRKLALHQMSFSGLGAMAGGPIGGKGQENATYDVGCRWNPERLEADILNLGKRMRKFDRLRITRSDFAALIEGAPEKCFIYADPPYYEKGPELYSYSMSDADHERLADLLRSTAATWVLSYDDHPFIRRLYAWANIEEVEITYTTAIATTSRRPKNKEVVISPIHAPEVRSVVA